MLKESVLKLVFESELETVLESECLSHIEIGIEKCFLECIGIRIGIHYRGTLRIRIRIVIHIFPIASPGMNGGVR